MAFGRYFSLASAMKALARGGSEKVCRRTASAVALDAASPRMSLEYCAWTWRDFSRLAAWLLANETAPAAMTATTSAREMRNRRL